MTTMYICVGTIFTLIKLLDILINLGQNRSSHGHTWSNVTFCDKSFEFDLIWLIFTKLEQLKLVSLPDWSFDSNFVLDWKWFLVRDREPLLLKTLSAAWASNKLTKFAMHVRTNHMDIGFMDHSTYYLSIFINISLFQNFLHLFSWLSLHLDTNEKWKLFYYSAYFCYYL